MHCFLVSAGANTEALRSQISTCQNSVLPVEALAHIPKTENHLQICRIQHLDSKQSYQSRFIQTLNAICKNAKHPKISLNPQEQLANPINSSKVSFTPGDNAEQLSTNCDRDRPSHRNASIEGRAPQKYIYDSGERLSSDSDTHPVSMSMIMPNHGLADTEEPKEGESKMAAKMRTMQNMLNQKLNKVKNINWNIDD